VNIKDLRQGASQAFNKGDYITAIQMQVPIYNHKERTYNDCKALALYIMSNNDFESGLTVLKDIDQKYPNHQDEQIPENIAICEMRCRRYQNAIASLKAALLLNSEKVNIHDALAESYGKLGFFEKSKKHATKSLKLKDIQSTKPSLLNLAHIPIPPFNPTAPQKNIISFSLGHFVILLC